MRELIMKLLVFFILPATLGLVSCSEDGDKTPLPKADFTYELAGETVIFTNTSTDGETYSWEFGDGETSTEESPSHTYGGVGAYIVKLTVTSSAGSDTKSAAIEVKVLIVIDGDMSDWDDVAPLSTKSGDNTGILNIVKATSDLDYIYFYMEGDDSFYGFVQLYLNADNDAATGWAPIEHPVSGADFELDAGELGEFWPWIGEDGTPDWNFEGDVIDSPTLYIPAIKTGNAVEFAIKRETTLLKLSNVDKVSFALGDVDLSIDWEEHGYLPNPGEDYIELELFK